MRTRQRLADKYPQRSQQQGAVAIMGAIWMMVALIVLMGLDIGNLFWQKRELQKIADMAALAGAQGTGAGCATAQAYARSNAQLNGLRLSGANADTFSPPDCGNWDPKLPPVAEPGINCNPACYFDKTRAPVNAVRVTVTRTVPYFFVFNWDSSGRAVSASATATVRNIAGFSIGTGVASVQNGLVNQLLNALLGTGNKISLDAVSYNGLVNAPIQLLSLVSAIPGIGNVSELLNTQIALSDFVVAMVNAVNPSNTVAISALNSIIATGVSSTKFSIGDLLKVTTPSPEAAATASVNAFDMLLMAAEIANGKNAVKLATAIDLGALATADVKLVVVEPPSFAIGEAGQDASGVWRTQAYSAAVRLLLDTKIVNTDSIPGLSLLLKVSLLRLPIYIEVAQGHARLTETQCAARREDTRVLIEAKPGIGRVCIAEVPDGILKNTTQPVSCTALPAAKISEVSLIFGLVKVLEIYAKVPVEVALPDSAYKTLIFNGVIGDSDDIQSTDSAAVGSVLQNAVGNFTDRNNWILTPVVLGILPLPVGDILSPVLDFIVGILSPLFSLLDTVVAPLLRLLGVQLGYSDVHHQAVTCGDAQLVY